MRLVCPGGSFTSEKFSNLELPAVLNHVNKVNDADSPQMNTCLLTILVNLTTVSGCLNFSIVI